VTELLWSVLIPTVSWREEKFLALSAELLRQAAKWQGAVEVVGLQNAGELSLARYRQNLLQDARGKYVSFVDDDDEVSPNFTDEICAALATDPDVVGLMQYCTGIAAPLTVISLRNGLCGTGDPPVDTAWGRAYMRTYSHVCPVRASIARQGTFMSFGEVYTWEDASFVASVVPLLEGAREEFIEKAVYHYRWNPADTTQQQGPATDALRSKFAGHPRPVIDSPYFRWCA
jgi:hypothetical protein